MSDRPQYPNDDKDEGFRLLGTSPPPDRDDGETDDAEPDPDEPRPFRARDLLAEPEDPGQFGAVPVVDPDAEPPSGDQPRLPHWTEPPTGEVPSVLSGGDDDLAPWSTLSSSQPRWRDHSDDWSDSDLSDTGDDLPRMGVRDDTAASDDFFTFDDSQAPPDPFTVPRDPAEPYGGRGADPFAEGRSEPVAQASIAVRAIVGGAITAVALLLLNIGPAAAMALVVVVLVLGSAELLSTLRRVGYVPPALIGLVAAAALPLAAYWRGEPGLVLALVLAVFVSLLWYLLDVGGEHAVPNIGVTLLTIGYVGLLGSFAALLLRAPHGVGMLLAAVLAPVAYDIAGFFIGRSMGRSPLSSVSPNKTVEGTIGGMVAALLVTWIGVGGVLGAGGITPFNSGSDALLLGVVLAVIAPIGDLCESMLKRDLNVKDMGSLLPGHGGVLDRFDAILVALPATYYVARLVF